jgi:hypothetical protein
MKSVLYSTYKAEVSNVLRKRLKLHLLLLIKGSDLMSDSHVIPLKHDDRIDIESYLLVAVVEHTSDNKNLSHLLNTEWKTFAGIYLMTISIGAFFKFEKHGNRFTNRIQKFSNRLYDSGKIVMREMEITPTAELFQDARISMHGLSYARELIFTGGCAYHEEVEKSIHEMENSITKKYAFAGFLFHQAISNLLFAFHTCAVGYQPRSETFKRLVLLSRTISPEINQLFSEQDHEPLIEILNVCDYLYHYTTTHYDKFIGFTISDKEIRCIMSLAINLSNIVDATCHPFIQKYNPYPNGRKST